MGTSNALRSLGLVDVEVGVDGVLHHLNLVSNPVAYHYV
jgi:hypothetical protein